MAEVKPNYYLLAWQAGTVYLLADLGRARRAEEIWADKNYANFIIQVQKTLDKDVWIPAIDPAKVLAEPVKKRERTMFNTWKRYRRRNPNMIMLFCQGEGELDFTRPWRMTKEVSGLKLWPDEHIVEEVGCQDCNDEQRWCHHIGGYKVIHCMKFRHTIAGMAVVPEDSLVKNGNAE